MTISSVRTILRTIYRCVAQLEALFPGRHFTPDGNMVGSLGEVLAATKYDIYLLRPNSKAHDATTNGGRRVQIRTTQGNSVPLKRKPDYLLVIKLNRDASIAEIFNGPGEIAWQLTRNRKRDANGAINIRTSKLRMLNDAVPMKDKIRLR